MNKKLFVGNLPFQTTEQELEEAFSRSGKVISVALPTDRETGRKRGFGFVEMQSEEEADAAIRDFNGQTLGGRRIVVNISRGKSEPALS
ncbi:MAG: RNA-binding protein [Candidatus Melainabacteria bacterium]|nr:MAG: RNA-binding protein [Candidatus Melainabacteria bacterium]